MAKRAKTTRRNKAKRNLDPLSTMVLAQGTGLDTALFGRKGFRALSDKRTYLGDGRKRNPEFPETMGNVETSQGHIEFIDFGSIERFVRDGMIYRAFTSTPVFPDGYRVGAPEAVVEPAMTNPVGKQPNPSLWPNWGTVDSAIFDRNSELVVQYGQDALSADQLATEADKLIGELYGFNAILDDQLRDRIVKLFISNYDGLSIDDARYRMKTPMYNMWKRNPAKFERCVRDVKARGGADNAYAVCTAAGTRNPYIQGVADLEAGNARLRASLTKPEVYKGEHAYTRKFIRQNEKRIKQLKKEYARANPADTADAMYEKFHGAPPSETLEYQETLHFHGHLGGLADLVHIVVKIIGGTKDGKELQLNAPDPSTSPVEDIVKLTANEAGTQLYFTGGDQTIDVAALGFRDSFDIKHDGETFDSTEIKDNMVLGHIYRIMYRTEKNFDNFETIDYHHEAGEDTGKCPFLTYDTLNNKMGVAGGAYMIHKEGIVN